MRVLRETEFIGFLTKSSRERYRCVPIDYTTLPTAGPLSDGVGRHVGISQM